MKKAFNKFMLLWLGELISAIGSGITSFGLGVYVFNQTGSASAMAVVTLLAFMPALVLTPLAGVLADRYDRRLLMMFGDGLSALGLVFILICMSGGEAQLWQICVGVTISSIFSSLLEPAYKATVTDLLTPKQYTKASGLVSIAGSAKYLISPIIAGALLVISDIKLLLIIDICTFFVTVIATLVVRGGIKSIQGTVLKKGKHTQSIIHEFWEGWGAVSANKGVLVLVLMGALITLFFSMLPFANSMLDYMLQTNIQNKQQGRAWGLIGVISQLGYVLAYGFAGMLADSTAKALDIGVGRGSALLIMIAGVLLSVTAVILYHIKSVKRLELSSSLGAA